MCSKLPSKLWPYGLMHAALTMNLMVNTDGKSPHELQHGVAPDGLNQNALQNQTRINLIGTAILEFHLSTWVILLSRSHLSYSI